MLRIPQDLSDRAEKTALLDRWSVAAEADPIAVLEERLTRAALSALAIDDPTNQDAILALMRPRSLEPARFAAFQTILCDTTLSEDLQRFQIETLLASAVSPND